MHDPVESDSTMVRAARVASITLTVVLSLSATGSAQGLELGVKAGINSSSVNAVPAYYDSLLCCHPLFPDAVVAASSGTGFAGGGFAALRIHPRFAVQGELLFSRKRHAVDLQP